MLFSEMYCCMKPGDMIVGPDYVTPHVELWFIVAVERGRDVNGEVYVHFWSYTTNHGLFTDRHITIAPASFHSYWQQSALLRACST